METAKLNPFYTSVKFKIIFLLILLFPVVLYAVIQNVIILYINIIIDSSVILIFAIKRYLYQKKNKKLDVEIAIIMGVMYWAVMLIANFRVIIFLQMCIIFLFLFVYRQTKISIRKNIIFLLSYGLFFFLLSFKTTVFFNETMGVLLSLSMSILFAYALLATSKTTHLYRCTYYCCNALLCLIIVGKIRLAEVSFDFEVMNLAVILIANILFYTFFYWYEGDEPQIGYLDEKITLFNIKMLPHVMGWVAFLSYLFEIDVYNRTAIWALIVAVLFWYLISVFIWYRNKKSFFKDGLIHNEPIKNKLDHLYN